MTEHEEAYGGYIYTYHLHRHGGRGGLRSLAEQTTAIDGVVGVRRADDLDVREPAAGAVRVLDKTVAD